MGFWDYFTVTIALSYAGWVISRALYPIIKRNFFNGRSEEEQMKQCHSVDIDINVR